MNCGDGEDSWESFGLQGDPTSQSYRKSVLNIHWKDWCWSWSSNTLATWCQEPTHWKRPWCWEILKAGGEGDDRGWDGWMASLTRWICVWVNLGVGDGQGVLACCSPWGCKESDMTEWLNWTEISYHFLMGRNWLSSYPLQVVQNWKIQKSIRSYQFSSVAQSCLTLCNPMNHSTPGLPVHHQLQEMGIQDHLTCLLRNLYAGQEATVRTGHGTTNWFQIGVHHEKRWTGRNTSWNQDCREKYQ